MKHTVQLAGDLTRAGVPEAGSAVTGVFASGAELHYDCTLVGAMVDPHTAQPKIVVLSRSPAYAHTARLLPSVALGDWGRRVRS